MSFREVVVLELRVALSRNAQPVWFRILKWTIIVIAVAYFWRAPYFWWWIAGAAGLAVSLHLLWRIKTKRWTQPWGGWNDLAATRPDLVAYGVYPDRASFEGALEALRGAGFRNSDISAILPDWDHTTKDLAHETNTKTPEGIAAGAGAAGVAGGLVGGLIRAGAPEVEAKRYAGRIREGAYFVSVHCDDRQWAKRAEEIMETTGGKDVVKTTEAAADYRP